MQYLNATKTLFTMNQNTAENDIQINTCFNQIPYQMTLRKSLIKDECKHDFMPDNRVRKTRYTRA